MNNYEYLFGRLAELKNEAALEAKGEVEALRAATVAMGDIVSPEDAKAKLEIETKKFKDNEDDWGTEDWYYRQGYKKGLALAEEKLAQFSDTIEFVQDYHPPEPQYKKEIEGWVQNKLKELGYGE